jgi:hypothetical protein
MNTTATSQTDVFNAAAVKALVKLARENETFTADDVVAAMPLEVVEGTNDTRSLSSVFAECSRSHLIQKTDGFRRSTRTKGPLTIWKSLLKK